MPGSLRGPTGRRPGSEAGFTTVQYVAACGLSLVLFVLLANLLVDLYARGAVHAALDEGVRAAVPVDADPGACEARARQVLNDLLRGPIRDGVDVGCSVDGDAVTAEAEVRLPSWLPGLVDDWEFSARALAVRER